MPGWSKRRVEMNFMMRRRIPKRATEEAMAMRVTMRPFEVRKTKSKKSWKNGIRKAPTIIAMMVRRRPARRVFRGLEIQ